MFDKKMFKQLEKMLGQMSPTQKEKLAGIMKDEESIKNALKNIDPIKAKQVAQNLNIDGVTKQDLGKMAEKLTGNPDIIGEIDKDK
ncbi:MAG: hypothetical protein IKD21_03355 [Clostridia bacterium]|nr:hypothetical protein [Clostridia bacterium]